MNNFTTLQQQLALTFLPRIGRRRMRIILEHTGTLEAFFAEKKKNLLRIPGFGETLIRQMDRKKALEQAITYAEQIKQEGYNCHFFQDPSYPSKLNECVDGPLLLFSKGKIDFKAEAVVAVVGTRNATSYGKKICEELISSMAGKNILVVSGLAYGIDIYIHELCVKHHIQTVAVLGHGLDRVYPSRHTVIANKMLQNGGLLSEFLPGTNPDRENFPMRNRIVAGLADATIVIESGIKGGSMITAEFANDYNRDVFAYPGDINRTYSAGCNFLIQKNKAHLITSSKDLYRTMNWEQTPTTKSIQPDLFSQLNPQEKSIVTCFKSCLELSFDYLIQATNLSFLELSSSLLNLEFNGLIKTIPGKRYQLTN